MPGGALCVFGNADCVLDGDAGLGDAGALRRRPIASFSGAGAPTGVSGAHEAACTRSAPLAEGGVVLGHELLIDDLGCGFNSPVSLHFEERDLYRALGVVPSALGLIDSLDEARACAQYLDSHAAATPHQTPDGARGCSSGIRFNNQSPVLSPTTNDPSVDFLALEGAGPLL